MATTYSTTQILIEDQLRMLVQRCQDIRDVLGTGRCACEGCQYETQEAIGAATEALALAQHIQAHVRASAPGGVA